MHLAVPDTRKLAALFSWFDDDRSIASWGGPGMRLPMTLESMQVDARIQELASWFLVSKSGQTIGFGQYYERCGYCHFGRLMIAPDQRGQRLGEILITKLTYKGAKDLGLSGQSLFVLQNNPRAIKLYERMGFEVSHYSGSDVNLTGIDYMVRR
ncbi:MAG: N-acetyltransferase family protein [Gammaproteobacteria bacterium]